MGIAIFLKIKIRNEIDELDPCALAHRPLLMSRKFDLISKSPDAGGGALFIR